MNASHRVHADEIRKDHAAEVETLRRGYEEVIVIRDAEAGQMDETELNGDALPHMADMTQVTMTHREEMERVQVEHQSEVANMREAREKEVEDILRVEASIRG